MARVVAFIPDLLFGSRVQAGLMAEGHTVELLAAADAVRDALSNANILVVDLTDEPSERVELVESLADDGSLDHVRALAFYSHVDVDVRQRAESASFDLIVPRSRMAREAAGLVSRLAQDAIEGSS